MSSKDTVFYKGKQAVNINFNAEKISSDGAILLCEKKERKHKLINLLSSQIIDTRHQDYVEHDAYKLLRQRVFLMVQGYQDCNDAEKLKNDSIISEAIGSALGSQPTLSRFENMIDKYSLFALLNTWLSNYIEGIDKDRKELIIDIDSTDDPTHGHQQLSLFSGFYGQFMYNELFFHDGETGEIILPILRPGNSHSNRWYIAILKRIVKKIKEKRPDLKIIIRADSGFSCPEIYHFAEEQGIKLTIGIAGNKVLQKNIAWVENLVKDIFEESTEKEQIFVGPFLYKAATWEKEQSCYAKVEYTGKGMNTRFFVSNFKQQKGREIYWNFYVKRGESSENRIKEIKNMCYSDRLSCHNFIANYFRLIISTIAYKFFIYIKQMIAKTKHEKAKKWNIDSIRLNLMKVGATIKKTVRRIIISFTKSYVYQELFSELMLQ